MVVHTQEAPLEPPSHTAAGGKLTHRRTSHAAARDTADRLPGDRMRGSGGCGIAASACTPACHTSRLCLHYCMSDIAASACTPACRTSQHLLALLHVIHRSIHLHSCMPYIAVSVCTPAGRAAQLCLHSCMSYIAASACVLACRTLQHPLALLHVVHHSLRHRKTTSRGYRSWHINSPMADLGNVQRKVDHTIDVRTELDTIKPRYLVRPQHLSKSVDYRRLFR